MEVEKPNEERMKLDLVSGSQKVHMAKSRCCFFVECVHCADELIIDLSMSQPVESFADHTFNGFTAPAHLHDIIR